MGSTMKKMTVILLLTALLAPGIAQAQVFAWESATVSRNIEDGFFGMVWNLLANMFEKNGSALDPSGCPAPGGCEDESNTGTANSSSDETIFNGSALDPSGQP